MQPHILGPLTLREAVEEQRRRDEVSMDAAKPKGAKKTAGKTKKRAR